MTEKQLDRRLFFMYLGVALVIGGTVVYNLYETLTNQIDADTIVELSGAAILISATLLYIGTRMIKKHYKDQNEK